MAECCPSVVRVCHPILDAGHQLSELVTNCRMLAILYMLIAICFRFFQLAIVGYYTYRLLSIGLTVGILCTIHLVCHLISFVRINGWLLPPVISTCSSCFLSATNDQLFAINYRLSASSYHISAPIVVYLTPVISYLLLVWLSAIIYQLSAARCGLSAISYKFLPIGQQLSLMCAEYCEQSHGLYSTQSGKQNETVSTIRWPHGGKA
jgi:hypothetical protein